MKPAKDATAPTLPQVEVSSASLPPGTRAGDYIIERALDRGGFGVVYRAVHAERGTPVAVKVLHADLIQDPRLIIRFEREVDVVRRLDHPNIVKVFEYGRLESGQPYFVMELLSGVSLDRHLARRGRLSPEEVVAILAPIARALDAAHAEAIVHRDIKAPNVFLCDGAATGRVILLDFGVAKLLDGEGPELHRLAPDHWHALVHGPGAVLGEGGGRARGYLLARGPRLYDAGRPRALRRRGLSDDAATPPLRAAPPAERDGAGEPGARRARAPRLEQGSRASPAHGRGARGRALARSLGGRAVRAQARGRRPEPGHRGLRRGARGSGRAGGSGRPAPRGYRGRPAVRRRLAEAGFIVAMETNTSLLMVLARPDSPALDLELRRRAVACAAEAAARLATRPGRDPRVSVGLSLHAGTLLVTPEGTLAGGGLLDPAAWVPAASIEGAIGSGPVIEGTGAAAEKIPEAPDFYRLAAPRP